MLTRAVDPRKGLFVQQAGEAVLFGRALEHGHGELLVVGSDVGGFEVGRNFELTRCHLVVASLGGNAQAVELLLHVLHEHLHALGDGAEVVVVELLALGGRGAKQGAAREEQVWAQGDEGVVDQEILLLGAAAGVHRSNVGFTEQTQQALGLAIHGGVGAQ